MALLGFLIAAALAAAPQASVPPSDAVAPGAEADAYGRLVSAVKRLAPGEFAKVRAQCVPAGVRVRPLVGEVAFQSGSVEERSYNSGVQDLAVSPSGAVAVASLGRGAVLVFPTGFGSTPVSAPLGGAYLSSSLTLSADGRRVAWVGGGAAKPMVMDLTTGIAAPLPVVRRACATQWFGRDLLVSLCPKRTVVFRDSGAGWVRALVADEPFHPPSGYLATRATADSAGASFLRGDLSRVYPTAEAAVADGGWPTPTSQVNPGPLRVGERLFTFPAIGVSGRMQGLDGRTGAPLTARDLPAACAPMSVAAAPDGRSFALLQPGGLVQVVQAFDLSTSAVFQLPSAGPLGLPTKLAFLPDARLAVMSADRVTLYTPPKS